MSRHERNPREILQEIVRLDGRYACDAYSFLFESLEHTLKSMKRSGGHVTGRELLAGVRSLALEQFGGLAKLVFSRWGVRTTDDIGEMVFHLVDAGLMGKTETDSLEDFRNVFDFEAVFRFDGAAPEADPRKA